MDRIIIVLFNIFYIIMLARVILSWIRVSPYHPTWGPIVRFIFEATEPILAPVRKVIPSMGGLDLSVIIVLIAGQFLRNLLLTLF